MGGLLTGRDDLRPDPRRVRMQVAIETDSDDEGSLDGTQPRFPEQERVLQRVNDSPQTVRRGLSAVEFAGELDLSPIGTRINSGRQGTIFDSSPGHVVKVLSFVDLQDQNQLYFNTLDTVSRNVPAYLKLQENPSPYVMGISQFGFERDGDVAQSFFIKLQKCDGTILDVGVPDPRLLASCLLRGAQHLHRLGIAHNDLKEDNIFRVNGRYVIGDFDNMAQQDVSDSFDEFKILDIKRIAAIIYAKAIGKPLTVVQEAIGDDPSGFKANATGLTREMLEEVKDLPLRALLEDLAALRFDGDETLDQILARHQDILPEAGTSPRTREPAPWLIECCRTQ
jgi:serine/threonine protein kinase